MSELSITDLSKDLRNAIDQLETDKQLDEVGVVVRIGDGVAWIHGLRGAGYGEVLNIETAEGVIEAFALNLLEDEIGAVLLGSDSGVKAGQTVRLKGTLLEVPVGPELLGRVVNPLGQAIDGGPAIKAKQTGLVEREAIGVMGRKSVFEPLMTGIMSIDAMFPIGRGQRELIIGDRQTGKTAIAIDTMITKQSKILAWLTCTLRLGKNLRRLRDLLSV